MRERPKSFMGSQKTQRLLNESTQTSKDCSEIHDEWVNWSSTQEDRPTNVEGNVEKDKQLAKSEKKMERHKQKMERRKQRRKEEVRRKKERRRGEAQAELEGLTEDQQSAKLQEEKEIRMALRDEMTKHLEECYERKDPSNCYRVCFNCSFGNWMSQKEIQSLAKQLGYCHTGLKRNLDVKFQYHMTSYIDSQLMECCNAFGAANWRTHFYTAPYWDIFPDDEIVVLSPDAEEELEVLDPNYVYVIGGLVDRSIVKSESLTQARALSLNIKTRRLPLKKHVAFITSPVLNVNAVVDIMREWIRTKDWGKSFELHIPRRKKARTGPRGCRKKARLEKLAVATSIREFAIAELEKLCSRQQATTTKDVTPALASDTIQRAAAELPLELLEALQLLSPYAERKIQGSLKQRKLDDDYVKLDISSEGDRVTSKPIADSGIAAPLPWPAVPLSGETRVSLSSLRCWLDHLSEEEKIKYRKLRQNDRWMSDREWNNEASTQCVVSMFQE